MGANYDKAKAAALKVLGASGDVPDLPDAMEKGEDALTKAGEEFDKSREDCEAKLLALQNANDALRNTAKQFLAKLEKSDFGLDSRNKEDLKKIQKARQLLTGVLDHGIKFQANVDKMLDELDKHLIQLSKYKQKPVPS